MTTQKTYKISDKFETLTRQNSDEFARDMENLLAEKPDEIIIDFEDVHYITSMALGSLHSLIEKSREHGGSIKLVNLDPALRRVLEMSGLESVPGSID